MSVLSISKEDSALRNDRSSSVCAKLSHVHRIVAVRRLCTSHRLTSRGAIFLVRSDCGNDPLGKLFERRIYLISNLVPKTSRGLLLSRLTATDFNDLTAHRFHLRGDGTKGRGQRPKSSTAIGSHFVRISVGIRTVRRRRMAIVFRGQLDLHYWPPFRPSVSSGSQLAFYGRYPALVDRAEASRYSLRSAPSDLLQARPFTRCTIHR